MHTFMNYDYFQENSNKEIIELTMCDIDQEFAIESRNRKRTFNYYRKLLAASNRGRGNLKSPFH